MESSKLLHSLGPVIDKQKDTAYIYIYIYIIYIYIYIYYAFAYSMSSLLFFVVPNQLIRQPEFVH